MPIFLFFIFVCLTFPLSAHAQEQVFDSIKEKNELPSLMPKNQQTFDNFIKAIKKLEIESFLKGKSVFNIKTATPREIVLDYKKSTSTGDRIYKGRLVRIKAIISDIRKNAFNKYYIEAYNDNPKGKINIFFDPRDSRYAQYTVGSQIDITCYGQGIQIAFPEFGQCLLSIDYINKKYSAIERHIALATQPNYRPISKKELSTIILYKSIEPQITTDCKTSINQCLVKILSILQEEPNAEAATIYAPLNEKYEKLPILPPQSDY